MRLLLLVGFNHGYIIRYVGMPSKMATSLNVVVGSAELAVVSRRKFKFKPALSWTRPAVQFADNSGAIAGVEQFVDEQLGEVMKAGTGINPALLVV